MANHRSFLGPFIVGLCSRRPVYYVAKQGLAGVVEPDRRRASLTAPRPAKKTQRAKAA